MRVAGFCIGLVLVLAGSAWAQVYDLPTLMGVQDDLIIDPPPPMPLIWSGSPASAESTQVVRLIRVNYLDLRMLCEALGGSYIDLRPLYAGYGGRTQSSGQVRGSAGSELNRNAPLAQFVPESVHNIVGIDF